MPDLLNSISDIRGMSGEFHYAYRITIASESPYTIEDAICNQYNKQFRFDEVSIFHTSTGKIAEPVRFPTYKPDEIEAFHQKLIREGIRKEIDWIDVESDFTYLDITLVSAEYTITKVNYVASRYAVLEERIERDYSGYGRENQMRKLYGFYEEARKTIADSYGDFVGGFLEENGAPGERKRMRYSLFKRIEERVQFYRDYIASHSDYAELGEKDKWLLYDDSYMAARLRDHARDISDPKLPPTDKEPVYSLHDLSIAADYVKQIVQQVDAFTIRGTIPEMEKLEIQLASWFKRHISNVRHFGIGDQMAYLLEVSFAYYLSHIRMI